MTMNEINLGVLLCDQAPELYGMVGYDEASRSLELIRLGSLTPAGCAGYVDQIARGTRSVRLDAARQLQRAGVTFNCSIPTQ